MTPRDRERRIAIQALHAIPDTPDLHRGHVLKLEGRPDRYALIPELSAAFIAHELGARSLIREER